MGKSNEKVIREREPALARGYPPRVLGLELLGTAVAAGAGVWCGMMAVKLKSLPFGLSAGVLLIVAPALAVAAWLARKDSLHWEGESPRTVLATGLRRVEASLDVVRLGRSHLWVIASFVVVLWVCEWGGLISARNFLVYYTAVWAASAALYLPWLTRREKRLYDERAVCRRLLREIEDEDRW